MALFVLCSAAGMIMVIGSLFLLWTRRIGLDSRGRPVSATKVKLPWQIELNTQAPVLVMFLFGGFLLAFPVYYAKNICPDLSLHTKTCPVMVPVTGKIKTSVPVDVYAVIGQQPMTSESVIFNVPFVKNTPYRIMYFNPSSGAFGPITDPFNLDDPTKPYQFPEHEVQLMPASNTEIPRQTATVPQADQYR